MPRRLISTGAPFEKTAGYSRAVVDGDFCFVAGTTGYDYASMTMPPAVMNMPEAPNAMCQVARRGMAFPPDDQEVLLALTYGT